MRIPRVPVLLSCLVVCGGALAAQTQQSLILPSGVTGTGNSSIEDNPFARQPMHYQQVYFAADIKKGMKNLAPIKVSRPIRIQGMRFMAKNASTMTPSVTLEMRLALHPKLGSISNTFAANIPNNQLVFPKAAVKFLPAPSAGTWVINLPFKNELVWDSDSDLVADIRIFGNSNNNKQFLYFFGAVLFRNSAVEMLASWNGPFATTASFRQRGRGLVTRFDFLDGVSVKFGRGCKGEANLVPQIAGSGLPVVPTLSFDVLLDRAAASAPAILLWGTSRSKWGNFTLPLDMSAAGMTGCTLYVAPDFFTHTVTSTGKPGTGQARIQFVIPPINPLRGLQLYMQWAILDRSTPRPLQWTLSDALIVSIG